MKTDIINKTKQSFELKEGNAGAYRFLKQLDASNKVSIKVDPNATYREYMVATGKTGESILLTSDDFSEYKVIDIVEVRGKDPGAPVVYKSVPSKPRRPGPPRAAEPPGCKSKAEEGSKAGVVSDPPALAGAGVASDPPASSAAGVALVLPASSAAGIGSVPSASSAAEVRSVPPASSAAGVESVPPASSTASSKPSKNERARWYNKPKSWFK